MAKQTRHFKGSTNPRELRTIQALMIRARPREEIDRIAGASNGPELIAGLRRKGLDIPCERVPCFDKDGREVKRGIYYFTNSDRRLIGKWQSAERRKSWAAA